MEVTDRFKGFDLVDRVPEELWTEVRNIVQGVVTKAIPKENKCKKAEWLSEEALQIAEEGREAKGKGEKERYTHLNAEFQRIARRNKKAFFSDKKAFLQIRKKWRKTTEWERLEISSRILEILRNISCKDGLNKGQKWYGPNRSRRY